MAFRAADTFTDSLARLTGDDQKAVKSTDSRILRVSPNPNLMYIRTFGEAWPDAEIVQQLVGQVAFCDYRVQMGAIEGRSPRC